MTGVSTLAQALSQIDRLKDQQLLINTLSTQLSTGKKTQQFSGLQQDVLVSKQSRADIKSLENYINNIDNADRRIQQSLVAIEEFKQQAENFSAVLLGFPQEAIPQEGDVVYFDDPATTGTIEAIPIGHTSADTTVDLKTLVNYAENVFDLLIDLVNVQDGDRYLLTGAETSTQPISQTSTLEAAISTLLVEWKDGTISTDDLIADLNDRTTDNGNLDAITDTIVGYSAPLSSGNVKDVYVRAGEQTEVDYTALATERAFRDVLVAVSYFKNENLGPVVDHVDPDTLTVIQEGAPGDDIDEASDNFYAVFNSLVSAVTDAIDDLDRVRFSLETSRARLADIKTAHKNEINLLNNVVADVENVDINEVAVSLQTLSVQLDASYRVTARISEISLVNFI